ncbi:hypothetical protein KGM_202492 [Danaus plexippus plexippus]|uniref:Uncharacterized protein n=1 Tax=Danaus plexippus plexippus TaxID=278856 RepID=A0A212FG53_DANPL|nr:hypothetical protein KGM_202492 [Danaus plexippus plexippus]
MGQNGGADFGALLSGAGRQILNQGGQALLNYGAQALGNIINEVFQKKEAEHKRVLPSIKNYKVVLEFFAIVLNLSTYLWINVREG